MRRRYGPHPSTPTTPFIPTSQVLEVRPPLDVANFCHLFGMNDTQCKAAITTVSRAVVMHASGWRALTVPAHSMPDDPPPLAGMRRHSVKAVVTSEPLPAQRKRRRSAMREEGGKEGEDEYPHSTKRHSTSS